MTQDIMPKTITNQANDSRISSLLNALERFGRRYSSEFIIDDFNKEYFRTLLMWFYSIGEFENLTKGYSLQKGLLIIGGVGSVVQPFFCKISSHG